MGHGTFRVTRLDAGTPEAAALAFLRAREWADGEDDGSFPAATDAEAGTGVVPATFVAVDATGRVVGGVGLSAHDPEGLPDRGPWVVGTVVAPDVRGSGVGTELMAAIEAHARAGGVAAAWVSTARGRDFYSRCGWSEALEVERDTGERAYILHKRLDA